MAAKGIRTVSSHLKFASKPAKAWKVVVQPELFLLVCFEKSVIPAEPRCPHGSALRTKDGRLHRCGSDSLGTECPINYDCVHDGKSSGCCPTSEFICFLPRNTGRSCKQTPTLRWYFDGISNSCRSFLFHGCNGNINNFPTKQTCDEFCPSTAILSCPYGGDYHRRGDGDVVECSSDKQCPSGYICTTMSRRGNELRLCCPTRLSICSQGKDEGSNCGQPATSAGRCGFWVVEATQTIFLRRRSATTTASAREKSEMNSSLRYVRSGASLVVIRHPIRLFENALPYWLFLCFGRAQPKKDGLLWDTQHGCVPQRPAASERSSHFATHILPRQPI
ncbi:Kunitz/Bovine pancreatic trypsin inhibitor domain protein [Ancylostoma duodenale]|uniref:Kunitz/Bovine pancreatic trypsin inhibitor domain protein n=1 Tax=Ancylostoma duodenale TaxID=51022 RepID=A0A0C2C9D3_9BILA|nr:Kunitz/Bovine pancreatic trypsin inhibitor domain protein [Ancylostoma duodenale]